MTEDRPEPPERDGPALELERAAIAFYLLPGTAGEQRANEQLGDAVIAALDRWDERQRHPTARDIPPTIEVSSAD